MYGKYTENARDKGKKKLVASEMPHQLMASSQIPGVGTGFQLTSGLVDECNTVHVAGPSSSNPNQNQGVYYFMQHSIQMHEP